MGIASIISVLLDAMWWCCTAAKVKQQMYNAVATETRKNIDHEYDFGRYKTRDQLKKFIKSIASKHEDRQPLNTEIKAILFKNKDLHRELNVPDNPMSSSEDLFYNLIRFWDVIVNRQIRVDNGPYQRDWKEFIASVVPNARKQASRPRGRPAGSETPGDRTRSPARAL